MKVVSFEVAKAIKTAGYPQKYGEGTMGYTEDGMYFENDRCIDEYFPEMFCIAPTYMDVWLWLWREKKICINCNYDKYNLPPMWWCNNEDRINYNTPNFDDPEEAIANAIEYLVKYDLIK